MFLAVWNNVGLLACFVRLSYEFSALVCSVVHDDSWEYCLSTEKFENETHKKRIVLPVALTHKWQQKVGIYSHMRCKRALVGGNELSGCEEGTA